MTFNPCNLEPCGRCHSTEYVQITPVTVEPSGAQWWQLVCTNCGYIAAPANSQEDAVGNWSGEQRWADSIRRKK